MSRESDEYRAAAQRSRAARHQFLGDLADTKARFAPDRLKRDIGEAAKHQTELAKLKAGNAVKRHPLAIAGIAAGLGAWAFRRPLAALLRSLRVKAAKAWRAHNDRRK